MQNATKHKITNCFKIQVNCSQRSVSFLTVWSFTSSLRFLFLRLLGSDLSSFHFSPRCTYQPFHPVYTQLFTTVISSIRSISHLSVCNLLQCIVFTASCPH